MIRLSPSRISLTEADINHHLQRILVNRALLTAGSQQADIDSRHGDSFPQPHALPSLKTGSIPSPSSSPATSTCTLGPPADYDVEYDEEISFHTRYDSSGFYPPVNLEKNRPSGQRNRLFVDGATSPSQLIDFEPEPDPYGYGMDIAGDGRISARRGVEKIPWVSTRAQISGSSLSGREGVTFPTQNTHELEALKSTHPGAAFSNVERPTASRSSSRSTGTRQVNRFRDPNPSLSADFRSSASGNQLDGSVAGLPPQNVPVFRHATVRKSSRLRIAQNAISEQSLDEDVVDEAEPSRTQERNRSSHHRRESTSYYGQSGSHPYKTSSSESGTLLSTDSELSSCLPNLSIQEDRNTPSDSCPAIYPKTTSPARNSSPRQYKSPRDPNPCYQHSSSFGIGFHDLESLDSPSSIPMYFPTSNVRAQLSGDPDAELDENTSSSIEEPEKATREASQSASHTQDSGDPSSSEKQDDSGEFSNTPSLPSISTSKREEEVLGPFIDRQFSNRPSIFGRSEMDVEMRGAAQTDRSEATIRQRLANVVKYFSEMDSSSNEGGDTESETADDCEHAIEEAGTSIQRNRQQDGVETSSVINIGPEQGRGHSLRGGVSTLPSEARGKLATPKRQGRLYQRSPTSLESNASSQVQREIRVYDDRVPATVERQNPARPSRSHFDPSHAPHTAPRLGQCGHSQTPSRCRHNPSTILCESPVARAARDQLGIPGPSRSRPNRVRSNHQDIGTTSGGSTSSTPGTDNPQDEHDTRFSQWRFDNQFRGSGHETGDRETFRTRRARRGSSGYPRV